MTYLLAVLRLIHIVAAVAWVGLGIAMNMYITPAAVAAGESGTRFMNALLTKTGFAKIFAIVAGITMLAGLLMYLPFIGGGRSFSTVGQVVLGLGALAGIAAGIHGGAVTGKATRVLGEAMGRHVKDGQPISAEGTAEIRDLGMKLATHTRLSFILMIVALVFMASARYL